MDFQPALLKKGREHGFSNLRNSESQPTSRFQAYVVEDQGFLQFGGSWHATCKNPVCMRIAFNNMHKSWVSSAKAALINMGHEFWRTSGAICRITEGMDTGLFN